LALFPRANTTGRLERNKPAVAMVGDVERQLENRTEQHLYSVGKRQ
jgi:hypothetical protein